MTDTKDLQAPAQAAHCFRRLMDAFSKPGTIVALPQIVDSPPQLHAGAASLALSLCDFQTPIWLSDSIARPDVRSFLRFHTGAPISGTAAEAAFAFMDANAFNTTYPSLDKGTDEYPDRSATAIVQVKSLSGPLSVRLDGPGIKTAVELPLLGLGAQGWAMLSEDRILFPRGIDVVFVSGAELVVVPRSSRIALLEND